MDNSSSDDSFLGWVSRFFTNKPVPGFSSGGGGDFGGGGASGVYEDVPSASGSTDFYTPRSNPTKTTDSPGARLHNPLGDYYSYTYQVSLYMITPDAYDDFISNNRQNIELFSGSVNTVTDPATNATSNTLSKGVYLIAQSGGINNDVTVRAPGFELDYYIDNLKIINAITPQATGMAAAGTSIAFDVIEPYGFSFITKLKQAMDALSQYSSTKNIKSLKDPTRQFYIIGVRFFGYDSEGRAITAPEDRFERYWDIIITTVKFRLDGRAVTYAVDASPIPVQVGFSTKRGMINKGASVKGMTIGDFLQGNDPESGVYGLFTKLNEDERNIPNVESYNTYSVEFLGAGGKVIENSKIVSDADLNKTKFQMGNAKSSAAVNVNLEVTAVPNVNARQITFKNDTPIIQAIQQVIAQSEYLLRALKTVYTTDNEPDPKTDSPKVVKTDTNRKIQWYMITTKAQNPKYDTKRNDFVFDITYVIQPYQIPIVITNGPTRPYYGPVKRYNYWFTGKNSEVIRYEQTLDNTYAVNVIDTKYAVPAVPDKRTNVQRTGQNNLGADSANQIVTQLMDPQYWATAKIEILGDPDLLIQPSIQITKDPDQATEKTGSIVNLNPFYGYDGFTVNPNNGQVFVEIDFNEGIDYDTNVGTMMINDQISMYKYPDEIKAKMKGVSFLVKNIISTFRGGRFTQELDCNITEFGANVGKNKTDQRSDTNQDGTTQTNANQTTETQNRTGVDLTNTSAGGGRGSVQPGSAATSTGDTSTNNGFVKPEPVSVANAATPQVVSTTTASGSQTASTATGQVSDDDGNLPAQYTPII